MRKSTFFKQLLVVLIAWVSSASLFAQDVNFQFDPVHVTMWQKFLKQPSAVDGKINAEVIGIDINRAGFNWDNPNTWANKEGKVYHGTPSVDMVTTIWGVSFSRNAPYNGGTLRVGWTRRAYIAGTETVFETGKAVEEKWIPYTPGLEDLAGTLELDVKATVVTAKDTKIEKIRLKMMNTDASENYLSFSRNQNLTQIDLSGSTAKIWQMDSYRNNFSTLDAIVLNNIRPNDEDPKGYKIFAWLTNIDDNKFRFSTMPILPDGRKYSGYKKQKPFALDECQLGSDGVTLEIEASEFVDLSAEEEVRDQVTTFVWKDMDGNVVTPTKAIGGMFMFNDSFIGKELVCEMTNPYFEGWICKTQPVKVVSEFTATGLESAKENSVLIYPNPVENEFSIVGGTPNQVTIYTLAGSEVLKVMNPDSSISVDDLATGNYIVKIELDGKVIIRKLLKK